MGVPRWSPDPWILESQYTPISPWSACCAQLRLRYLLDNSTTIWAFYCKRVSSHTFPWMEEGYLGVLRARKASPLIDLIMQLKQRFKWTSCIIRWKKCCKTIKKPKFRSIEACVRKAYCCMICSREWLTVALTSEAVYNSRQGERSSSDVCDWGHIDLRMFVLLL